jgi:hypothetical protein
MVAPIKITYYWSEVEEEGKWQKGSLKLLESYRDLTVGEKIIALDFLQDLIGDAQAMYNSLLSKPSGVEE